LNKSSIPALVLAIATVGLAIGPAQAGTSEIERVCAPHPDQAEREGRFARGLAEYLRLSDAQKASYQAFQEAREKSVEAATTRLCAKKPDVTTFEGRLVFHQAFLEDRLAAVKAENPSLIAFYNSLDAEQKIKFDRVRKDMSRGRR
jgi:hypothetical protein